MTDSTTLTPLMHVFLDRFDDEDDAALWTAALDHILAELERKPGVLVEIGRCSHWLRPHQSRWTAQGGFALPVGYGKGRHLPLFDWSVVTEWSGDGWTIPLKKTKGISLRVAIPSRTTRHQQAALHTLWTTGKKQERRLYGFRKKNGEWQCTAESEWAEDRPDHRRGKKRSA